MTLENINHYLKNLAEIINHTASIALKLIIIGAFIVFEQWIEHYQ